MDIIYKHHKWSDYLFDELKERDFFDDLPDKGDNKMPGYVDFMRELYGRFYSNPERKDVILPEHKMYEMLHDEASKLDEFSQLKETTSGSSLFSGMATKQISETVLQKFSFPTESIKQIQQVKNLISTMNLLQKQFGENPVMNSRLSLLEAKQEQLTGAVNAYFDKIDPSVMRNTMKMSIQSSLNEIESVRKALEGLSIGYHPGELQYDATPTNMELVHKLKLNRSIQHILEKAGRVREFAKFKQQTKAAQLQTELSSIMQSNDISRLLPVELINLSLSSSLFFKKYFEKQLLTYELLGKESKDKGPVIVLIDKSGSMKGNRFDTAKAIALAMMDIAISQNRFGYVIFFDYGIRNQFAFEPNKKDEINIMNLLSMDASGGTNISEAVKKGMDLIKGNKYNEADLIIISDGDIEDLKDDQLCKYKNCKKEKDFHTYSILVVEDSSSYTILRKISNEIWMSADIENIHKFSEGVFEI